MIVENGQRWYNMVIIKNKKSNFGPFNAPKLGITYFTMIFFMVISWLTMIFNHGLTHVSTITVCCLGIFCHQLKTKLIATWQAYNTKAYTNVEAKSQH